MFLVPFAAVCKEHESSEKRIGAWSGSVSVLLDYRENERENDFDVGNTLRLKNDSLFRGKGSFYFHGRHRFDLSGKTDRDNAHESKTDTRIFQTYFDFRNWAQRPSYLRIGRQWLHDFETVHIDGLLAGVDDLGIFDLKAFYGRPVSEFVSTESQFVYGAQFGFPFLDTRFRLNYIKNDQSSDIMSDQISLFFTRRLLEQGRLYGEFKRLDSDNRELRAGTSWFVSSMNMDWSLDYYRRLNKYPEDGDKDAVKDDRLFSEYARVLGQSQEIERTSFNLMKYFNRFAAGAGIINVDVLGGGASDSGNRETQNVYASFHVFDWPLEGLDLSFHAHDLKQRFEQSYLDKIAAENPLPATELLPSDPPFPDQDIGVTRSSVRTRDDAYSLGIQLDYQPNRDLKMSGGFSYSDYDFSTDFERNVALGTAAKRQESPCGVVACAPELLYSDFGSTHVNRNYFWSSSWQLSPAWRLRLRADYDRSRVSNNYRTRGYKNFRVGLNYRF